MLGRAGALVRLGDEEHAAIVEVIASWLRSAGFDTEAEGSFSEWGERGRIDLLAFDPSTGTFVIVEVKTQLLDLQDCSEVSTSRSVSLPRSPSGADGAHRRPDHVHVVRDPPAL